MNTNWPRWIFASIAEYMRPIAAAIPLPLLVEGIDDRIESKMEADHAELRVNGPAISEISSDYYRLVVDVNVLLTDLMDGSTENAYDLIQWGGVFQEALSGPISIYKYGSGADDDDAYIGCLEVLGGRDSVKLFHFGQISKVDRVRQSMVDSRFSIYLEA